MEGYKELKAQLIGVAPLICHNGQLADPLNRFAKEIKKIAALGSRMTEDQRAELSRVEFLGGFYLDDKGRPCIKGELLEASLIRYGASIKRKGNFQSGLMCEDSLPIEYAGPKDPEKLWLDRSFVLVSPARIGKARVMRTRPIFRSWSINASVFYNSMVFGSEENLREALIAAGRIFGIGDWRPKYGRFEVKFNGKD